MNTIALPVQIITYLHDDDEGRKIYYPQIKGLEKQVVQDSINDQIINTVQELINKQYREQDSDSFAEMVGTFEIKTNERNILSLSLSNYAIREMAAHGLTFMESLTFDTQTGREYQLADLFQENSNYVEVLSDMVRRQINERQLSLLEPFTTIQPNQDFYIADKALVVYFQPYEISPYYVGLPMFPISVFSLTDISAEDGPLSVMATNS